MVNEDIVGGLRLALSRGETLKQAMMAFFNAGYKSEDIEWAAKTLQLEQTQEQIQQQIQFPQAQEKANISVQKISNYGEAIAQLPQQVSNFQSPVQKISSYSSQKQVNPPGKSLIIILIVILVFLFGALTSLFLFKDEIISLFGSFS